MALLFQPDDVISDKVGHCSFFSLLVSINEGGATDISLVSCCKTYKSLMSMSSKQGPELLVRRSRSKSGEYCRDICTYRFLQIQLKNLKLIFHSFFEQMAGPLSA